MVNADFKSVKFDDVAIRVWKVGLDGGPSGYFASATPRNNLAALPYAVGGGPTIEAAIYSMLPLVTEVASGEVYRMVQSLASPL